MSRLVRPRGALVLESLEDRANPVSFSSTDSYGMGSDVRSVAVGDLNGDGHADIAAGDSENGVEVLLNDGTGGFVRGEILPIGAPFNVKLADLNGDGKLDIYVSNAWGSQLCAALGNGDGTFQVVQIKTFSTYTQGADAADFNGDGKLDVVVADERGAAVLMYDGSPGLFSAPVFYHPDTSPESMGVATGDFNGDGHPDFALIEYGAQRVDIYLNKGDGTFGTPTPYADVTIGGPRSILARDFNNDGILDLMMDIENTSYLGLYLGNGDGTFQSPIGVNTSLSSNGPIAAADFDLDGNLDLVAMRGGDGDEIVMLGDGAGHFTFGTTIFYAYPGGVAPGDLNGDGRPDLVTGHALSPGELSISANTTPVSLYFVVSAPTSVTAGDSLLVTVTARGPDGAVLTDYEGTVHFASTDTQADLPADYQFTPADNGSKTFTVTLKTAGDRSITLTDPASAPAYGQTVVNVRPAAASTLTVDAPGTIPVDKPFPITITARDMFGNVAVAYSGTVHFTSTDSAAALPPDATLTFGVGTVSARFGTAGTWTITAADSNAGLSADSDSIVATPISLTLEATNSITVGRPFPITIAAHDGFGNVADWYSGPIHFTSTDTAATLPADLILAGGIGTTQFSFGTAGTWTITAADTKAGISVDSNPITVNPILIPPIVADFGTHGLRRWTEAGGWVTISKLNAESVAVSADATTVVADFGVRGLKRWTEAGGWHALTTANVGKVDISTDGETVVANFPTGILKRWTEASGWVKLSKTIVQQFFLSDDGATVVADFGKHGLQRWTETGGWTVLDPADPGKLVISADGSALAANFAKGLWYWSEAGGWTELTIWHPQVLTLSSDGSTVFAGFTQNGLWNWTTAGGWVSLLSFVPEALSASSDGQRLVADGGKSGVGLWTQGEGWVQLSTANVQNVLISSDGNVVIADFGLHGLQDFGFSWATLLGLNPEQIVLSEPAT